MAKITIVAKIKQKRPATATVVNFGVSFLHLSVTENTGRCPVGVATQDPKLRKRLNPDDAALRVYNYLHTMTLEAQLLARACGKTNIHSLEPEDLAALTMEASALAKVPLSGTNHTVGVDDFHKI